MLISPDERVRVGRVGNCIIIPGGTKLPRPFGPQDSSSGHRGSAQAQILSGIARQFSRGELGPSAHHRPATRQNAISAPSCDSPSPQSSRHQPTHLERRRSATRFPPCVCSPSLSLALADLQYRPASTFSTLVVAERPTPACGSASHLPPLIAVPLPR